ncbi:bifunctional phosphopantothenoylcysteine decarboxylase/phosphopantothenate--cysteine ligase CoaBC [Shimazuella alba]|uniref:Coenzyme A biosynthesis bifunctional protein CoaBC n=1 Tax=Shimazuella alba TaxID=2690964 RepID=A0A6I4VP42_9BACL|nr:bifunctional phosphopantothenoylcysteine decarboxylase/phosphopantothenate--cysteine ligase CoaBC [Shimazuella alba]MXQ53327.1 bifunctional phosphopantothenoylcysteine decarboxylase/phosphopantothenate--cysteine ligase CoaBC [Shimazuella alba]
MEKKRILLGITGGIAAYKSATIASKLTQLGMDVRTIMTKAATEFITPLTLQTLTRNPVAIDTFDERDPSRVMHIDLADHADLVLVAPATANIIGKMANGLADDMLSTAILATEAPIVLAPAMNVHMYQNAIVQENMKKLASQGVQYIEPGEGQLACGYVGKGRLAEPEDIVTWVQSFFAHKHLLSGKTVLITAGPTIEAIDPVRYLSNHSSGKMGYALASAALSAGAKVILVSGPVSLTPPNGAEIIQVKSAQEMYDAVLSHIDNVDIVMKAAAVSDYRPKEVLSQKRKKHSDNWEIELIKNPDIAYEVGKRKRAGQLLIGFAAETENIERYAREKLEKKNMDFIVANNVLQEGAGFSIDTNAVSVYGKDGLISAYPVMPKRTLAEKLIKWVGEQL